MKSGTLRTTPWPTGERLEAFKLLCQCYSETFGAGPKYVMTGDLPEGFEFDMKPGKFYPVKKSRPRGAK